MKYFPTIISAINYQAKCPLCDHEVRINDRDLADDYGYDYSGIMPKISFRLSQMDGEIIKIDPINNEVELILLESTPQIDSWVPNYHGAVYSYVPPPPKSYSVKDGMFMHALNLNCQKCCQFAYTVQLHVDLGKKLFMGAYLNSESISLELDGAVHEIKNIYATKKTIYSRFPGSLQSMEIPLIDLDLKNPQEAIARIKKLIIFS